MELDNFQLGVRHLPLEDLCDGVGQLPPNGCYSLELDNFQHIDVIHWSGTTPLQLENALNMLLMPNHPHSNAKVDHKIVRARNVNP